ncbi:DUF4390 domain-containing protein [Thiomicrorhabdus lithotrophica]|uniref:DUF4390 domain-containing protein n=1 Tax=Thiomicrorhabdus lithotrophica TaxID=2949997 RepID=A0ABY8CA99_9GAMM|nr:DUF4390 domain-containing protein [Thiomicrorhabdus lithotrophica]WEJ62903.1 DUF4390 domain-containing protein [Thiomicrorhabdus lithotrophica]
MNSANAFAVLISQIIYAFHRAPLSFKLKGLKKSLIKTLFMILPGLVIATPGLADYEIEILKVRDYQQNKQLLIDSESRFNLPQEVIDAVHHEIPLSFNTRIELTERKSLLGFGYERSRNIIEYRTDLYAYGVNRLYALYNHRNKKTQTFITIDEALQTLATLQAFPVASLSELHPEQRYTLRMRISLDFWKLPTPLILEALTTSTWRLESQWFETSLQTPLSWQ